MQRRGEGAVDVVRTGLPVRHCAYSGAMKEELSALQSLGLVLPSPAWLFGMFVFGIIGIAAFQVGRRRQRPRTKWLGVALMFYPYLVSPTWLLYGLGIAMCVMIFRDRG